MGCEDDGRRRPIMRTGRLAHLNKCGGGEGETALHDGQQKAAAGVRRLVCKPISRRHNKHGRHLS